MQNSPFLFILVDLSNLFSTSPSICPINQVQNDNICTNICPSNKYADS